MTARKFKRGADGIRRGFVRAECQIEREELDGKQQKNGNARECVHDDVERGIPRGIVADGRLQKRRSEREDERKHDERQDGDADGGAQTSEAMRKSVVDLDARAFVRIQSAHDGALDGEHHECHEDHRSEQRDLRAKWRAHERMPHVRTHAWIALPRRQHAPRRQKIIKHGRATNERDNRAKKPKSLQREHGFPRLHKMSLMKTMFHTAIVSRRVRSITKASAKVIVIVRYL